MKSKARIDVDSFVSGCFDSQQPLKCLHPERLMLLAEHLRKDIQDADFFMAYWSDKKATDEETGCGFAGCAMGHACYMPEFRALGLRMTHKTPTLTLIEDEYAGFNAAKYLFGISYVASHFIFDLDGYDYYPDRITKDMVADRIEAFVQSAKEHSDAEQAQAVASSDPEEAPI